MNEPAVRTATVARVLLTGMSGTGKSTLLAELGARGHRAVDLDAPDWSHWVAFDGNPTGAMEGRDWVWREERVAELLAADAAGPLFVAGCAANMGPFLPRFDQVVLLSAPDGVLRARLATRSGNAYGRRPEEWARVLVHLRTIEPRLRRVAHHEIDTSAPLGDVVARLLRVAGLP